MQRKRIIAIFILGLSAAWAFADKIDDDIKGMVQAAKTSLDSGNEKDGLASAMKAIKAADGKYGQNNEASADCYKMLGDYFYADFAMNVVPLENQKSARDNYLKAYQIFETLGGRKETLAEVAAKLGICLGELGDVANSTRYLQAAENLLANGSMKNPLVLADVYQEFGFIAIDNEKCIEYSQKAKDIAEKNLGNQKSGEWPSAFAILCKANHNIAASYASMGDKERAILYYEDGMKTLKEKGAEKTPIFIKNVANLGSLYSNTKEFTKAEELLENGLKISMEAWGKFCDPTRRCERGLGMLFSNKKDYESAKTHYAAQAEIALKVLGRENSKTAEAYRQLGVAERMTKDYKNSISHLKEALEIQKGVYGEGSPALADCFRSLGYAYRSNKDYKNAEKCWKEELSLFEKSNKYEFILSTCWANITNWMDDKKYNWTSFLHNSAKTATAAVERARTGSVGAIRDSILEKAAPFYYAGIELALGGKKQDVKAAFDYAEGVKSRGFLDQIGSEIALSLPEVPPKDAVKVRELESKISSAREELSDCLSQEVSMRDSKKLSSLAKSIEESEKELARLEKELGRKVPKYAQLRNPSPASADDAQKFCQKNQAIVEFVLWNDEYARRLNGEGKLNIKLNSYAIVITKKKAFAVKLDDLDYDKTVNSLRDKIFNHSPESEFESERNELYKGLLAGVIKGLPKEVTQLLIVPDGNLAFLPFDILRESSKSPELSAGYELSFSPSVSISMLKSSQEVAKGAGAKMLAMGGAWYDAEKSANQHKEAFSSETRGAARGALSRATKKPRNASAPKTAALDELQTRDFINQHGAAAYFKDINLAWNDLPGTLTEIEEIEAIKPIEIVNQESVTEAKVKELSASGDLARYAQLHFACHGRFDEKVPEMSGIVFSEVSQKNAKEDGYLTIPEILPLNINSDFVCLSACETGRGRTRIGDGLTGLSRAFMVSGTKKIGVTLWCVDDAATCDFMIRLYKKIDSGVPYSTAYYQVRNEFREHENEAWRHPYYRSAFVLYE